MIKLTLFLPVPSVTFDFSSLAANYESQSVEPPCLTATHLKVGGFSFEPQFRGVLMETALAPAGHQVTNANQNLKCKQQILESILGLSDWLDKNDYRGYDTFDGLNAKYLR